MYLSIYECIHMYMPIPAYAMAPFGSLNTAKFQIPDRVLLQRDKLLQPWGHERTYIYI